MDRSIVWSDPELHAHIRVSDVAATAPKAPIVFGTTTPISYDFWAVGSIPRMVGTKTIIIHGGWQAQTAAAGTSRTSPAAS